MHVSSSPCIALVVFHGMQSRSLTWNVISIEIRLRVCFYLHHQQSWLQKTKISYLFSSVEKAEHHQFHRIVLSLSSAHSLSHSAVSLRTPHSNNNKYLKYNYLLVMFTAIFQEYLRIDLYHQVRLVMTLL